MAIALKTNRMRGATAAGVFLLSVLTGLAAARDPAERTNLALNKPATASSIENDEHAAARANDGDTATCWRADDEPEGGPEWWQVDLQAAADLSGCQITWPYKGMNYRFRVEGSTDGKKWVTLSDQTRSTDRARVRDLKFDKAQKIRYVRITVTGFDDGCWASISEVKVFGTPAPRG
jgi:alpha-L-fucosidase